MFCDPAGVENEICMTSSGGIAALNPRLMAVTALRSTVTIGYGLAPLGRNNSFILLAATSGGAPADHAGICFFSGG
jgi:hypothetical protein